MDLSLVINKYLLLYSSCVPVRGINRSTIYDLQRKNRIFIPNALCDLLLSNNVISIKKLINENGFDKELESYLSYIISNNCGELIDEEDISYFPKMNLEWDYPSIFTNVVIEVDKELFDYEVVLMFIEKIHCKSISIKFISNTLFQDILSILEAKLSKSVVNSIDLQFDLDDNVIHNLTSLSEQIKNRLRLIRMYGSNSPDTLMKSDISKYVIIENYKDKLMDRNSNYIVKNNMIINIPMFTESQFHNTYYNRKLFIGSDGSIKNASECSDNFGNLKSIITIDDIFTKVNSAEFQRLWFIHKELIDTCKACEYRHMCVDNCLPIEREAGSWYRSAECNYNPYVCKWDDEDGYLSLRDSGVTCDSNGLFINNEILTTINSKLWDET